LIYYLNFKYGYSLEAPVPNRELHEVRERDYFFIVSFSVWGLWAGMGIATLWKEAAEELKTSLKRTVPILGLAFIPLVANWGWASRAKDYAARDWAYNLLISVEPYGILFTNGDNDTFPLWYLQEVEGIRQDVTVIVTSYLNTDWYTKQLRDLTRPCLPGTAASDDPTLIICQRPYTAENTGAAYVSDAAQAGDKVALVMDHPITVPTKSILSLDDATIERVARSYAPVDQDQSLRIGNVIATLYAGDMIYPWIQYALVLINESIGERPIYFASSGNAASSLGMDAYIVREGLAFKLSNGLPDELADDGVVPMQDTPYSQVIGDYVNVPRTRVLVEDAFMHSSGMPESWSHWPDEATIGIPNYYAWTYLALAQAALQHGDTEAMERFQERTQIWSELGR